MGRLENGKWLIADELKENSEGGDRLHLAGDEFDDAIETTDSRELEPGRYHLIVSLACPWAQRTLIVRNLLGLEDVLNYSVVDPVMLDDGWTMTHQPFDGQTLLRNLYVQSKADYTGKVTVPVLWDRAKKRICNNSSLDICRQLSPLGRGDISLYPSWAQSEIDALLKQLNHHLFISVYQAGFAVTDRARRDAVERVFRALEQLEQRLATRPFLVGENLTLADICLFTTLIRFDPVYKIHFLCDRACLTAYPSLHAYIHRLAERSEFSATIDLNQILDHYYRSHLQINPGGVIPELAQEGF